MGLDPIHFLLFRQIHDRIESMETRRKLLILFATIALMLVLFVVSGPGIIIYMIGMQKVDRMVSPGIKIINDTDKQIAVITSRDSGFGSPVGSYCFGDNYWCQPAMISPGKSVIQSHGRYYQSDKVQFLNPVEEQDYYVQTGSNPSKYKLRDDMPVNFGRIQESPFLCYEMDLSSAEENKGGILRWKRIYSFRWLDVLKHPVKCGYR